MIILLNRKRIICIAVVIAVVLLIVVVCFMLFGQAKMVNSAEGEEQDLIKWVDFNVSYQALDYAIKLDIKYHDSPTPMSFIDLLAYIAAKNGNNFKKFKTSHLDLVADQIKNGKTIEELTAGLKYYDYYHEAFTAALSGWSGLGNRSQRRNLKDGQKVERKYGIKPFPFAKGFTTMILTISASAVYGFDRRHLGHDMMGSVGTR